MRSGLGQQCRNDSVSSPTVGEDPSFRGLTSFAALHLMLGPCPFCDPIRQSARVQVNGQGTRVMEPRDFSEPFGFGANGHGKAMGCGFQGVVYPCSPSTADDGEVSEPVGIAEAPHLVEDQSRCLLERARGAFGGPHHVGLGAPCIH